MDGTIAQEIVQSSSNKMPVIFITANHDVAFAVQVMLAGAVDVLPLMPTEAELFDAVNNAFSLDGKQQGKTAATTQFAERFNTLTQRERQIMTAVVKGSLNKQVAYALGLSVITIKMHRGSAMRKMGATTFADLVKIAGVLGLLDSQDDAVFEDSADIAA
ncbi:two-component response regulator [Caballeronia sordidicola]|uniref:Two-component response regulator n=2 Tax=Burkholderiales TaxID=80840 RepID=A0A242M7L8_CABSO|nr:two-component response regulator [Caballeronia sordidicola]